MRVCSWEIWSQSLNAIHLLANQAFDIAAELGAKRVFTITAVPHIRDVEPQIFEMVNKPELRKFLEKEDIQLANGDGRIIQLNELLIEIPR